MDGSLVFGEWSEAAAGRSSAGRSEKSVTVQPCSDADFRLAMRQLPGAVCVIATEHGGARAGFVATAVCSVSADPPTLLVCINKNTSAHDPIVKAGRFSVNLLSVGHVKVSEMFSGQGGFKGADRFNVADWSKLVTGAPVFEEAVAAFDCCISKSLDAGTHTVVFGVVVATRSRPDSYPLTYLRGQYLREAE